MNWVSKNAVFSWVGGYYGIKFSHFYWNSIFSYYKRIGNAELNTTWRLWQLDVLRLKFWFEIMFKERMHWICYPFSWIFILKLFSCPGENKCASMWLQKRDKKVILRLFLLYVYTILYIYEVVGVWPHMEVRDNRQLCAISSLFLRYEGLEFWTQVARLAQKHFHPPSHLTFPPLMICNLILLCACIIHYK